jgi:hypothetical protein
MQQGKSPKIKKENRRAAFSTHSMWITSQYALDHVNKVATMIQI